MAYFRGYIGALTPSVMTFGSPQPGAASASSSSAVLTPQVQVFDTVPQPVPQPAVRFDPTQPYQVGGGGSATGCNGVPYVPGSYLTISFIDENGTPQTQDFQGAMEVFKLLRPNVQITGCVPKASAPVHTPSTAPVTVGGGGGPTTTPFYPPVVVDSYTNETGLPAPADHTPLYIALGVLGALWLAGR